MTEVFSLDWLGDEAARTSHADERGQTVVGGVEIELVLLGHPWWIGASAPRAGASGVDGIGDHLLLPVERNKGAVVGNGSA